MSKILTISVSDSVYGWIEEERIRANIGRSELTEEILRLGMHIYEKNHVKGVKNGID